MQAKTVIDYSAYLVVRAFLCVVQALPMNTCLGISNQLGSFCWKVLRLRRQVVEENLRTAFPQYSQEQRERIAIGMWQHLFLMIMEIAHAPRKVHRTNWRDQSSGPGMNELLRTMLDERPTVLICGHLGNFEMGGYLIAMHGFPTHTIARPLDNRFLDQFFKDFRESTGQYMLTKRGSSQEIDELLKRGGTLGLLGDQDAGSRGCWVDFFGKPASTHKAVGLFTLSGGVPTAVCASIRRRPLHFELCVSEVIDPEDQDFAYGSLPELTGWYTNRLEELVRETPEQYWWVHRRWKSKPGNRRALREAKRARRAA